MTECIRTAPCGLVCEECRAYKATRANDTETLLKIGKEWGEGYGREIKAEEVMCDGCRTTDGRVWLGCRDCDLRNCDKSMQNTTCAHCTDYSCPKTEGFWGKKQLDAIHAEIKK